MYQHMLVKSVKQRFVLFDPQLFKLLMLQTKIVWSIFLHVDK